MIIKTISARGSKGHHDFTLSVQEDNTSGNSSFISYTFKISATSSSWQWRSYNNITYTISINGTNYTGTIPNFNGSTTTLKTGSNIEIPHNSDGTKTISIGFNVTDPNTSVSYTCGNASASDTMALTTLHTSPEITNWSTSEQNALIGTSFGSGKIINHLSIKKDTIRATTFDGATLSKFRVYNGTQLLSEITSNTSPTEITTDFANVELQTYDSNGTLRANITIEVEDSMGGIGQISYEYQVYNYNLPNIITTSTNVKRNGQSTGQVNLNLKATYKSGTIGLTTNSITLEFAYWEKGQTESTTYYTIPSNQITISDDDITISSWTMYKNNTLIEDVSPSSVYYFKFKITDAFSKTGVVLVQCIKGEYLIGRYKDRVDFKKITQQGHDVELKPVVLYDDPSGEAGNVTLDDTASKYSYLEIFGTDNNGQKGAYMKICDPTEDEYFTIQVVEAGTSTYIRRTRYKIQTNSLVMSNGGYVYITSGGSVSTNTSQNYIKIIKVLGWV